MTARDTAHRRRRRPRHDLAPAPAGRPRAACSPAPAAASGSAGRCSAASALAILAGPVARAFASSPRRGARPLANGALRESEGKLRALVGALEEAVFLVHADGSVELLNAPPRRSPRPTPTSLGRRARIGLPVDDDGAAARRPADTPVGALVRRRHPRAARDRHGPPRPRARLARRQHAAADSRPGETTPYAVVSSCTDVTERQNLEAHLLDLADRDPLTGLWNRRRFEQDLAHQLDRCRRYGERAALVLMDIDGFKQVNDVLGHLAGDEVLCALGDALRVAAALQRPRGAAGRRRVRACCCSTSTSSEAARIAGELAGELTRRGGGACRSASRCRSASERRLLDRSHGRRQRRARDRRPRDVRAPSSRERRTRDAAPPTDAATARRQRRDVEPARPARRRQRARQLHGDALARGRHARARRRAPPRPRRGADAARSSTSRCCTTSARSPCPTPSCASPAR